VEGLEIFGKEFARLGERLGLANYLDDEDRNGPDVPHNMQGAQARAHTFHILWVGEFGGD
jgi:hypothetical protein